MGKGVSALSILQLSLKLLLMSLLGYVARKTHVVGGSFEEPLSRLLIDVVIPCYVLSAILSIDNLEEMLSQNGSALVAALALMACLFLLGLVGRKLLGGNVGRIFHFGTMFSNALVFGMPIAEAYWGMSGLLYLMTFYIPVRLGYYGLSELLISPAPENGRAQFRRAMKFFVSPTFLMYMGGLLLLGFQIRLPGLLLDFCAEIGACCTPLGMLLIGIIIGGYRLRQVFSIQEVLLTLYKLVALPALAVIVLLLLGIDGMPAIMAVLYCALPCGTLLTSFCVQYDPDAASKKISAGWILLTTACAVFTVPLWLSLIEHFRIF